MKTEKEIIPMLKSAARKQGIDTQEVQTQLIKKIDLDCSAKGQKAMSSTEAIAMIEEERAKTRTDLRNAPKSSEQ